MSADTVETFMAYCAKVPGAPGFCAITVDDAKYKKWVAKDISDWVKAGYTVVHASNTEAIAGLNEYSQWKREQKKVARVSDLPLFEGRESA
jgi:hypothetical protein